MLGLGLQVAMIGIIVVFVILTGLIGIMKILTAVAGPETKETAPTGKIAPQVEQVLKGEAVVAMKADDEEDVMAVIAAAVAIITKGRMAVKTITRVDKSFAPSWSFAGRQDTMSARQI